MKVSGTGHAGATGLIVAGIGVALPGVATPSKALEPTVSATDGWFDVSALLPGRGYKRLPAACQYLLAATKAALADAGEVFFRTPAQERGVVIGTNNAAAALLDDMDRTIIDTDADLLSPLTAPFFAMSVFASRLSTEHGINGFNLTSNAPRTAGLDAIVLGARAVAAGRARVLVVGATEAALPDSEPEADRSDVGAVAMICTHSAADYQGEASYGHCRVRQAFLPPGSRRCDVEQFLCSEDPLPVDAVLDDSPTGRLVSQALDAWGVPVRRVAAGPGALSPLRRLVGLLAAGESDRLVITAAAEGNLAVARLTPSTKRN